MSLLVEIVGWTGTGLIVLAYFLLATKRVGSTSRAYRLMNLFGPIGIGINVYVKHSWPALALQLVWFVIALMALAKSRK